ncbi:hypothetical protein NXH56_07600 [Bifidobacterium thermophilum]|nr:hypothetical protein [Bifidobacterium thermophilum]
MGFERYRTYIAGVFEHDALGADLVAVQSAGFDLVRFDSANRAVRVTAAQRPMCPQSVAQCVNQN